MACPYCTSHEIEKVKVGFQPEDYKYYCNNCGFFFDTPSGPKLDGIKNEKIAQLIAIKESKISFIAANQRLRQYLQYQEGVIQN